MHGGGGGVRLGKHIEKTDFLNTHSKETFYHMRGGVALCMCGIFFGFFLRKVFFYDAYAEAHVSI